MQQCPLQSLWCLALPHGYILSCAVQFVAGGLQISVVVAIDFTASNGDVLTPGSLHYNRLVSETIDTTTTCLVSCICTVEYQGR
jgi:hypothetical protein